MWWGCDEASAYYRAACYDGASNKKIIDGRPECRSIWLPPFPGRESHYVRAIISLISADTKVAPIGFFGRDEDSNEILSQLKAEENLPDPLKTEEVNDLSCWTHFELSINAKGRMTAAPQVENEEGDLEPDKRYEEAESASSRDALGLLENESENWKASKFLRVLDQILLGS